MSELNKSQVVLYSQRRSLRLEQTSHVLDAQDVDTLGDELINKVEVVLERILCALRIGDVTAVAYNSLTDTTRLLGSIDTKFQLSKANLVSHTVCTSY